MRCISAKFVPKLLSNRKSHRAPVYTELNKSAMTPSSSLISIYWIVRKKCLPHGQPVSGKFYCEVLKRLKEVIWRKFQTSGRITVGFSTP
ncbi:hypothetical protein PR048_008610 [Dryococelus australis]|uniref:Uncharacterized protein n=1 Tax=Dryococelus australis TaxID=614101 RepID=A0ABQ9HYE5_9NEOP|nr:hypothetical protein PR048_008610 [Dryococelus australis]